MGFHLQTRFALGSGSGGGPSAFTIRPRQLTFFKRLLPLLPTGQPGKTVPSGELLNARDEIRAHRVAERPTAREDDLRAAVRCKCALGPGEGVVKDDRDNVLADMGARLRRSASRVLPEHADDHIRDGGGEMGTVVPGGVRAGHWWNLQAESRR